MNRIRNQLIVAFVAATIVPLGATLLIMTSLLERSLSYATTGQLDRLSESLHQTGLEYYQQACEILKSDAKAGIAAHQVLSAAQRDKWPPSVVEFFESSDAERFDLTGTGGTDLQYLVRRGQDVWLYTRPLGNIRMDDLSAQYSSARELVSRSGARNLRRGFTAALLILVGSVWIVSLVWLVYLAYRMSRPIQQLTAGLSGLAGGNLKTRIVTDRNDEIGKAIAAFNHTAGELERSTERLVYLTQIASWQSLARKMAHELKNSLTPIRLTMEEILARQPDVDRQFLSEAARIVVDEVETLERRVRAFSDFSAEPAIRLGPLDLNGVLEERVAFLKGGHTGVHYRIEADPALPAALADADRVKGILTNLLENGAEAAGPEGTVLGKTYSSGDRVMIEIHDSGPGLSAEASKTLFEPSISFKSRGMGLGLSIARKDALVCGGDLMLVAGMLGGAGFRLVLPKA